jgi:hypothetical protein
VRHQKNSLRNVRVPSLLGAARLPSLQWCENRLLRRIYFDLFRDWLIKFTNNRKAPALPSGNWRENESPV